jgi:beta-mannosidase
LRAEVEPAPGGYAVVLEANRFAHAVTIDVDGFVPDDNYLHLEPGQRRRIALHAVPGATRCRVPAGRVTALTGCGFVPLVVPEVVDAR